MNLKFSHDDTLASPGAVGLYVPGGTAVLPSSALMLAVPAGIAGCKVRKRISAF